MWQMIDDAPVPWLIAAACIFGLSFIWLVKFNYPLRFDGHVIRMALKNVAPPVPVIMARELGDAWQAAIKTFIRECNQNAGVRIFLEPVIAGEKSMASFWLKGTVIVIPDNDRSDPPNYLEGKARVRLPLHPEHFGRDLFPFERRVNVIANALLQATSLDTVVTRKAPLLSADYARLRNICNSIKR